MALSQFPNIAILCNRDERHKRSIERLLQSKPNVVQSLDIYAEHMENYLLEQRKRLQYLKQRENKPSHSYDISKAIKDPQIERMRLKLQAKQFYCRQLIDKQSMQVDSLSEKPTQYSQFGRSSSIASLKPIQQSPPKQLKPLNHRFNYYIHPSSNEAAIRQTFKLRKQWVEIPKLEMFAHFTWMNQMGFFDFGTLTGQNVVSKRQMINYLEMHTDLTTKTGLFNSLMSKSPKQNIMPLGFVLNFKIAEWIKDVDTFAQYFIANSTIEQPQKQLNFNFYEPNKSGVSFTEQVSATPITEPADNYIWLLKPADWGRGQGIEMVTTLQQIEQSILQHYNNQKQGCKEFIIQKYIEKPLLYQGRKFDIRCWVLINQENRGFLFKEGYCRTSSLPFDITSQDPVVHLTNYAIQQGHPDFQKYEPHNQLSFSDLEALIPDFPAIQAQIKAAIVTTLLTKLNRRNRKYGMQILGYDFMIDSANKVWLIEINANPNLQMISPLLQVLIPKMLDGAFKLSLDMVFSGSSEQPEGWDEL